MSRLPRNVDGTKLADSLGQLGFKVVRRSGSHIVCRTERAGAHTEVIPATKPLKVGTLGSILNRIARHLGMTRDQPLDQLDL